MILVKSKYDEVKRYVNNKDDLILEIGAGTCDVVEVMRKDGFKYIVPLDVVNLSFIEGITPIIYDGRKIPFENSHFNISLLITTLHHIKDPILVLKEALRVSKKIVIVEEIYENSLEKYWLYIWDNITNLEFFGNPHSNNDDLHWRQIFKQLKLNILDSHIERCGLSSGFLTRVSYLLSKK